MTDAILHQGIANRAPSGSVSFEVTVEYKARLRAVELHVFRAHQLESVHDELVGRIGARAEYTVSVDAELHVAPETRLAEANRLREERKAPGQARPGFVDSYLGARVGGLAVGTVCDLESERFRATVRGHGERLRDAGAVTNRIAQPPHLAEIVAAHRGGIENRSP
ncbi:MAG: hypothetical protein JRF42_07020 [Deltaproteobacteria bacterium]|nr:hypothetical protein [Deltaproteobacteria bacterium]